MVSFNIHSYLEQPSTNVVSLAHVDVIRRAADIEGALIFFFSVQAFPSRAALSSLMNSLNSNQVLCQKRQITHDEQYIHCKYYVPFVFTPALCHLFCLTFVANLGDDLQFEIERDGDKLHTVVVSLHFVLFSVVSLVTLVI